MRAAVVTISDRCHAGARQDASGPLWTERLRSSGWEMGAAVIVPDDRLAIVRRLIQLADEAAVALILTTGGTGAGPRDVTPEATRMVIERPFPGIAEALRAESARHTPYGLLSRGEAGARGRTLIVNLPGNPVAAEQLWPLLEPILEHACRLLAGEEDPHR